MQIRPPASLAMKRHVFVVVASASDDDGCLLAVAATAALLRRRRRRIKRRVGDLLTRKRSLVMMVASLRGDIDTRWQS